MSCLVVAIHPSPFCLPIAFAPSPLTCPLSIARPSPLPAPSHSHCHSCPRLRIVPSPSCSYDHVALSPSHQPSPLGLANTGLLSCPRRLLLVCAIASLPALSLTHAGCLPCPQCPHPARTNHGISPVSPPASEAASRAIPAPTCAQLSLHLAPSPYLPHALLISLATPSPSSHHPGRPCQPSLTDTSCLPCPRRSSPSCADLVSLSQDSSLTPSRLRHMVPLTLVCKVL